MFTVICAIKIPFIEIQDDVNFGYTPKNARSLVELKAYNEFSNGDPLMIFVFVTAADGGSMARLAHLNETVAIVDEVGSRIKIKNQSFYDICTSFCNFNEPVVQFRNGMLIKSFTQSAVNGSIFEDLSLRYPIMKAVGRELDLSPNFHGVETYEEGKEPKDAVTNIKYLKLIALIIRANRPDSWTAEDADAWDIAVRKRINEEYNDSLVVPRTYSVPFFQAEVTRTSAVAFPYIANGFAFLVLFSLITVALAAWYLDQLSVYKLVYATVACITPLMAVAACLGLLFWCGFRFGSILLISPFLLLAFGVDDAYIVINGWERLCVGRRQNPIPNDNLQDRITEAIDFLLSVLVNVGPSITVTSLTNMLAFAVSALSATPEIRLFCIANVVSMFFDLIFTTTLFLAVMVIGARYEMESEESRVDYRSDKLSSFLSGYCEWLSSAYTSVCIFVLMCIYWGTGIYGIMNVTPSVRPTNLLVSGSPVKRVLSLRDEYVRNAYSFVTVIVGNASNLTDAERRKRIFSMVEQFEAMPECNGPRFTKFWMRDYEKFLSRNDVVVETDEEPEGNVLGENEAYSDESIEEFLKWPDYNFWGAFMKFENGTNSLAKFSFFVPYHGQNISEFREKLRMLNEWRAIADNYTDLSVSVYDDDAHFTDQIEALLPQTVQNAVYSFACIALICTLFMQNLATVFAASVSILSIFIGAFNEPFCREQVCLHSIMCVRAMARKFLCQVNVCSEIGVAGFMTLWSVELDPLSMATVILSIGMSVDYPAHIAYHYYHILLEEPTKSAHAAMAKALSTVAFPLLQCSASNVIVVLCLLFAQSYMSQHASTISAERIDARGPRSKNTLTRGACHTQWPPVSFPTPVCFD
ncbi:unnamed protein product [Toxocara canis]|uniref:SSD domain-containing protein n=1 Tax=Toxocara canis TaxID=6265 RepID=A0A3P7GDH5_TOXCA|nr:unnamed protein product [Toxocara canis]